VRSSDIRRKLGVEPLLLRVERSQLRWFGQLIRMPPPLWFSRHIQLGGDPRADPEPAEGLSLSSGLGTSVAGEKEAWGGPCLTGCHRDPAPDKRTRMNVDSQSTFMQALLKQ